MNRPLKILMVLHMPWDRNLGGPRVQIELADEFRAMGHEVEKFDYHDAFPQASSSRLAALTRPIFSSKAKAFVQAHGDRFDIIDAHQGNLPFSKQELGFHGLLVARSGGLYALYEEFAKLEKLKWPPKRKKTIVGNLIRSWQYRREYPHYLRSLQTCDLINLHNQDELAYVRDNLGMGNKCVVFTAGLSQQRQEALASSAQPAALRLARKTVAFIGAWQTRKGSRDWAEIIRHTKTKVPEVRFLFLGTALSAKAVLEDLDMLGCDWIEIVPTFSSEQLPQLLSEVTVGAFPSYIEGFGIAVLEKLASGLPTVAYDVPGPREMLRHLDSSFMVPAGDIEQFSNQLVKLLKLDEVSYSQLSQRCTEIAKKFYWGKIAEETLDIYSKYLVKINATI